MAKKDIYEKIVQISEQLKDVSFANRVFESIASKDEQIFNRLLEGLYNYKFDAYNEILNLGNIINKLINTHNESECSIFSDKENSRKGIYKFDTNIYDSLSIIFISFLGKFEICDLFQEWNSSNSRLLLMEDIARYKYLSKFVSKKGYYNYCKDYSNLYDLLIDVFDGKFE